MADPWHPKTQERDVMRASDGGNRQEESNTPKEVFLLFNTPSQYLH